MRLPKFTYCEPKSLTEVFSLISNGQDAVIKAGGTDLIPRLKLRLLEPKVLINLRGLSDFDFIRKNTQGDLCIGAMASLWDIETSPLIQSHFRALAEAVAEIASIEIRYMGTLGGNICLDTRCQFYNQSPLFRKAEESCFKTGGSKCYISREGSKCHALFCGDTVPLLVAAGVTLEIISSNSERFIPIQDFYTGDGKAPFVLMKNELVAGIQIPKVVEEARAVYLKYRFREAVDFPIVGVAVLEINGRGKDPSGEIRIVVGGATSRPSRCFKAEAMLGTGKINPLLLQEAAETAAEEIRVVSSSGCSVSHRRTIVKQLVIRGVQKILEETL